MRSVRRGIGCSLMLWVGLGCSRLVAAPLDETTCKAYDTQQKSLEAQGLNEDVAKGPEWAKANLSDARVVQIKQYIFVKEQVAFRCPSLIVVSVPALAEPEAKQPQAQAVAKSPAKAKKKRDKKRKKSAEGSPPPPPEKTTATP